MNVFNGVELSETYDTNFNSSSLSEDHFQVFRTDSTRHDEVTIVRVIDINMAIILSYLDNMNHCNHQICENVFERFSLE